MINKIKAIREYIKALKVLNNCRNFRHIHKKVRVVFILQYLPAWEKIKILYDKMLLEDKIDPFIVCVPMEEKHKDIYYSKFEGNETYDFFISQGYQAINAMEEGCWFDLRSLQPDYIFYTRPYNIFLPKEYKSSYTAVFAKICVVMYGVTLSSIGYSVINRDFFDYVSCYFAENEAAKHIFTKKFCLGIIARLQKAVFVGVPILETVYEQKDKETDIWNFGEGGLKTLWLPRWSTDQKIGGSNFFRYKDELLDFYSRNGNKLLIRPHPLMFQNFINTGEWNEMQRDVFISTCEKIKNVRIDTSQSYIATIWSSDILISDFTSLIIEYFLTGKPIIYCYPNADITYTKLMKEMLSCCYIVKNKQELIKVLINLESEKDPLKTKREYLAKKIWKKYAKGCSSNIIELLSKRSK